MKIQTVHSVFFIGVGGIGMSALARYFNNMGKKVGGYDRTKTPLTAQLEREGIHVHYTDAVAAIPEEFKAQGTLVIYTPAVPYTHAELQFFRAHDFSIKKRSEVLGWITQDTFCFAVAGTHGKTTTSCILAHLLKETGSAFTAFLGGISEDFNSNFAFFGNDASVVEADEFDRSFLHLSPNIACITSMDADHLDIYGEASELEAAFYAFANRLKKGGALLVRQGLPIDGITFGLDTASDYSIQEIRIKNGRYHFTIKTPSAVLEGVEFGKPGHHNLLNALAAFAMAAEAELPLQGLATALGSFKGVERRFSYQINSEDLVFIDDYAHHPAEIDAVHQAVSEMHPNQNITVVFQPHLFTRTQDFAEDFGLSLSKFDCVLLLEIYPAREVPIPGITSTWLLDKIDHPRKKVIQKSEIVKTAKQCDTDVLLTLGAGDIGLEVPKIKKELAYAG